MSLWCATTSRLLLHPSAVNTRVVDYIKRGARLGRSARRPAEYNVNSSSPLTARLNHLIQPLIATVTTIGVTYGVYLTYKQTDKQKREQRVRRYAFHTTPPENRTLKGWWASRYTSEKMIYVIIGCNVVVFLAWKRQALQPILKKYFVSNLYGPARTASLLGCTFSHISAFHLFVNMYVLHSLGSAVSDPALLTHLYVSGGLVSGLVSYLAHAVFPRGKGLSVGASGAILSLIGYICLKYPDTKFAIAFVKEIYPHSITANNVFMFLLAFDTCGLVAGWQLFDHAAHLGGMLYGGCSAILESKTM